MTFLSQNCEINHCNYLCLFCGGHKHDFCSLFESKFEFIYHNSEFSSQKRKFLAMFFFFILTKNFVSHILFNFFYYKCMT